MVRPFGSVATASPAGAQASIADFLATLNAILSSSFPHAGRVEKGGGPIERSLSAIYEFPAKKCPILGVASDGDRPSHNAASVVNNALARMQQWLMEGMTADGRTTRAPLASKKKVTRIARVAFLILADPLPRGSRRKEDR
jgi:hypothetical protein